MKKITKRNISNYYWAVGAAAAVIAVMAPGIGTDLALVIIGQASAFVGLNTKHGVVVYIRNSKISSIAIQ